MEPTLPDQLLDLTYGHVTARLIYGHYIYTLRIPTGYRVKEFRIPRIGDLVPHVTTGEVIEIKDREWEEWPDNTDANNARFILEKVPDGKD